VLLQRSARAGPPAQSPRSTGYDAPNGEALDAINARVGACQNLPLWCIENAVGIETIARGRATVKLAGDRFWGREQAALECCNPRAEPTGFLLVP
jgi:hypothetical protein